MKSEGTVADVIIIGGGFSGTMLAAQLTMQGVSSIIVEGRQRAGRGTAFSTPEAVHLLNVPARKMSAWPDRPDDFAETVADEGYEPNDFVPRARFGAYLGAILDKVLESKKVTLVRRVAVAVEQQERGWSVALNDGSNLAGRALALAQGNQPPEPLAVARDVSPELFVNDPWSEEGRDAVANVAKSGGDVLIVGTGLTMVDVALSLDAAGHQGRIVALSRRGLIPRAHAPYEPVSIDPPRIPTGSVTGLWRWLRSHANAAGWRAAVDSLRPHSHALWQSLSNEERRRFLRHARPWWDVHRHRIAPEVATILKRMIGEGQLEVIAGQVVSMREGNQELIAGIKRRGTDTGQERRFALGLNCTGPLGTILRSEDGVLRGLIETGLARPDALGIGLEADQRSRVSGGERLWAVGPLTKGALWEIVAVPDIRGQAAAVAQDIAEELHHDA